MIDNAASLRQLVLPAGAQPGTPRIVMGPDIPAPLATLSPDVTFYAAFIYEHNATDFYWEAVGSYFGDHTFFRGNYDTVNGVFVLERALHGEIRYGSTVFNKFNIDIFHANTNNIFTSGLVNILQGTDYIIDGTAAPRGLVGHNQDSVPSGAVGNVEATILFVTANIRAGRAYKVSVFGRLIFSATTTSGILLLRANTSGGVLYASFDRYGPVTTATNPVPISEFVYMVGTATAAVTISLSLWGVGAGTVTMNANTNNRWGCIVEDVGAAADYPGYPAFV